MVLAARNTQQLDEVVLSLQKEGIQAIGVKTDVSIEQDCKNLIDVALSTYGKIDIFINNAGISMRALFEDVSLESFTIKTIEILMIQRLWKFIKM